MIPWCRPIAPLGVLAAVAVWGLAVAPAGCRVELTTLDCVADSDCPAGQTCQVGVCTLTFGAADVADSDDGDGADADAPLDVRFDIGDGSADGPLDAADAADLPEDSPPQDTPNEDVADPPIDDADAIDTSGEVADTGDGDVTPPPCPDGFDVIDGVDADGDGTDGHRGHVVLLDPSDGDDGNALADSGPVRTLVRASQVVEDLACAQILVSMSDPVPVTATITFADHTRLELAGGYEGEDWISPSFSSSAIAGDESGGATPLLVFVDVLKARLVGLDLQASPGRDGDDGRLADDPGGAPLEGRSGENSIGIAAYRSDLTLSSCDVRGARGGDGGQGRPGRIGPDGNPGQPGSDSTEAGEPAGGPGGEPADCFTGKGFAGGDGGSDGPDAAGGGIGGDGPDGGAGGVAAGPQEGGTGGVGYSGRDGAGGGAYGYVRLDAWHPVAGAPGRPGGPGSGGGGGASGHQSDGAGLGGGGGGSGGCGGEGGGGGGGGGGSIAVYLQDSHASLEGTTLHSGQGGDGGPGGPPGAAGGVGAGGPGGSVGGTPGHPGGAGGAGGDGGGGGSGAGGIAVGLVLVGDSSFAGGLFQLGTGGLGGGVIGSDATRDGADGDAGLSVQFAGRSGEGACRHGAAPATAVRCDLSQASICIDRYEASADSAIEAVIRPERSILTQALGLPAELPWTDVDLEEAMAGCQRGGGFLCQRTTLANACRGAGDGLDDPTACNFSGAVSPTGSAAACVTDAGDVHDLLGNVEEWAGPIECSLPPSEFGAFGGSYLDAPPAPDEDECAVEGSPIDAEKQAPELGFRCCSDPQWSAETEFATSTSTE